MQINNIPSRLTIAAIALLLSSCAITFQYNTYYLGCNPHMAEAKLRAMDDDWMGAMQIWTWMVDYGNDRQAAKAAFNMAIGCEFMGRRDIAIEWVRKAAFDFDCPAANAKALAYLYKLENLPVEEMQTTFVITER